MSEADTRMLRQREKLLQAEKGKSVEEPDTRMEERNRKLQSASGALYAADLNMQEVAEADELLARLYGGIVPAAPKPSAGYASSSSSSEDDHREDAEAEALRRRVANAKAEAEAAESRRRLAEDQRRGLKAQEVDTAVAEWRKSTGNGAGTSLKGVPQAAGKTAVSGVAEQRRTWDLSSSEDEGDEDVEVERPMRGETVPLGVEVEGNSSGFGDSSSSEHLDSDSDKEEEEEEDEEDPMGDALLDLENADIDAYAKKYGIILVEGDEEEGDAQRDLSFDYDSYLAERKRQIDAGPGAHPPQLEEAENSWTTTLQSSSIRDNPDLGARLEELAMREAKYQAQMESSEAAKVVGKHGLATNLAGNSEELRRLLEQSRHLSPRKRDPESDRSDKDVDWEGSATQVNESASPKSPPGKHFKAYARYQKGAAGFANLSPEAEREARRQEALQQEKLRERNRRKAREARELQKRIRIEENLRRVREEQIRALQNSRKRDKNIINEPFNLSPRGARSVLNPDAVVGNPYQIPSHSPRDLPVSNDRSDVGGYVSPQRTPRRTQRQQKVDRHFLQKVAAEKALERLREEKRQKEMEELERKVQQRREKVIRDARLKRVQAEAKQALAKSRSRRKQDVSEELPYGAEIQQPQQQAPATAVARSQRPTASSAAAAAARASPSPSRRMRPKKSAGTSTPSSSRIPMYQSPLSPRRGSSRDLGATSVSPQKDPKEPDLPAAASLRLSDLAPLRQEPLPDSPAFSTRSPAAVHEAVPLQQPSPAASGSGPAGAGSTGEAPRPASAEAAAKPEPVQPALQDRRPSGVGDMALDAPVSKEELEQLSSTMAAAGPEASASPSQAAPVPQATRLLESESCNQEESTSQAVAPVEDDTRGEQYVANLMRGSLLLKFCKEGRGKPHPRFFFVRQEDSGKLSLVWKPDAKSTKERPALNPLQVQDTLSEAASKNPRQVDPQREKNGFTVLCSGSKTKLFLVAATGEEHDMWVEGLTAVIRRNRRQQQGSSR